MKFLSGQTIFLVKKPPTRQKNMDSAESVIFRDRGRGQIQNSDSEPEDRFRWIGYLNTTQLAEQILCEAHTVTDTRKPPPPRIFSDRGSGQKQMGQWFAQSSGVKYSRPLLVVTIIFIIQCVRHDLLKTLKPSGKFLKNQVERSTSSVVLNIAEANGRFGQNRNYHFKVALGSLIETESALKLLVAYGEIKISPELNHLMDECGAILWTLIHKR